MTHIAFIAIGSNLGDRWALCEQAIAQLAACDGIIVTQQSRFSEYSALTVSPNDTQPAYVNGVVQIATTLAPHVILETCHAIETSLGRTRPPVRWAPRIIDLDLLSYDALVLNSPTLTLPHPELHKRRFVLEPLAEIAPTWMHPHLEKTVRQLLLDIKT